MPMLMTLVLRQDDLIVQRITEISEIRATARSAVPAGFEEYFRRHARVQSAHGSVSIEGNPLELVEVQRAALQSTAGDNFRREARNAERAHRLIRELSTDSTLVIDSGLIRMINVLLLEGLPGHGAARAGVYRQGGSMIINTATGQFVYTGPPAAWVPELMSGLERSIVEWVSDAPPEIAAAKAHFSLVSIHPFSDGNGRTARLLADLILARANSDLDGMIALSSIIRRQRDQYYEALQASQGPTFSERVDVTDFVRFHTGAIAEATRQLEARALNLQRQRLSLLTVFGGALNDRRVIGINSMIDLDQISSSDYAELVNCSQPTAFADLGRLVEHGLVARVGRGKGTRYRLTDRVLSVLAQTG